MKKKILILLFPFLGSILFAQDKIGAEKLVSEGIKYHDKGEYNKAISLYDKALVLDKDNLLALTEKAYTLLSMGVYKESIEYCQKILKMYPNDDNQLSVYVTYGSAYDGLKMTDKSLAIYDEGIKKYPENYLLYFNKGITLIQASKFEEAQVCFEHAVKNKPDHSSSHNAIARIAIMNENSIPAVLSLSRFLSIERQSDRAVENKSHLQNIMKGKTEVTGKNSITIQCKSKST